MFYAITYPAKYNTTWRTIILNQYTTEIKKNCIIKLQEFLDEMPSFCCDYFMGMEGSARTKLGYCRNVYTFLQFVIQRNPIYKGYNIKDLPIQLLDQMTPHDFDEYKLYLQFYTIDGVEYANSNTTIARNLSAISSMYKFFLNRHTIKSNPLLAIDRPKIYKNEIIALNDREMKILLDKIENPDDLTEHQKTLHKLTVERDKAIFHVFLGTGIRISELVGLDLDHIDFYEQSIRVTRKGGNEETIYFDEKVCEALLDYLEGDILSEKPNEKSPREKLLKPKNLEEKALFLSLRGNRIAVRSVEVLVEKYTKMLKINKKITPHKLRSTYGTALYKDTEDIYLVASVLGHSSVETTQKNYVHKDAANKKRAVAHSPLSKLDN